jgi:acetoin utilization deacetylase AcuC-like enzyme
MTVDCDVHDGNGTAAIFPPRTHAGQPLPSAGGVHPSLRGNAQLRDSSEGELEVFTISLHQAHNYPAEKPPSSIDVNLPDGADDAQYLGWLEQALSSALRQFEPELICYIAGADPYCEDQLGGLALSIKGLRQRDELVLRVARSRKIPVMITYAGGYARHVQDTVTIHCNTVIAARDIALSPTPVK